MIWVHFPKKKKTILWVRYTVEYLVVVLGHHPQKEKEEPVHLYRNTRLKHTKQYRT